MSTSDYINDRIKKYGMEMNDAALACRLLINVNITKEK